MGGSAGSIGRIALVGLGAVIGGAVGMPGVGAAIGGIAGQLLFPEKLPGVSGPRLGDQELTTSTEGTAIPLVYGTHVVSGNIIWASPLEEVANTEEAGGKGGPTQEVTEYSYFMSYALGLCEGDITGVIRIWENGKIIYDRREQQPGESSSAYTKRLAASDALDESMTIYTGSEDQMPDPVMESHEGAGEVSAHRGLAYVVFERRDVTQNGGRPFQYKFEVTKAEIIETLTTEYSNYVLYPWDAGAAAGADPRNCQNDHEYRYIKEAVLAESSPGSPWRSTLAAALADFEADTGFDASLPSTLIGWSHYSDSNGYSWEMRPYGGAAPDEREVVNLHFNDFEPTNGYFQELPRDSPTSESDCDAVNTVVSLDSGNTVWWGNRFTDDDEETDGGGDIGLYYRTTNAGNTELSPRGRNNNNCPSTGGQLKWIPDVIIQCRRVQRAPSEPCVNYCTGPSPDYPPNPDEYCEIDGTPTLKGPWVLTAGEFKAVGIYAVEATSAGNVLDYPVGAVLPTGHASYNDAVYWAEQYSIAVTAGQQRAGKSYDATGEGDPDTTYPVLLDEAFVRTAGQLSYSDDYGVSVASIIRDQCERSGLVEDEHFDVSERTEIVHGYKVERVMSGRDIIEPLRSFGLFDGVETDKLRFPTRGQAVVDALTDDDLGAAEPDSNTPPPLVTVQRVEDVELPYLVRIRYADTDSEYQAGQQKQSRKVGGAQDSVDQETTIAMDADRAAQMADVLLQEAWMRRETYALKVGPHKLDLIPGDAITIPLRGETQRCVITSDTSGLPGIREFDAARDDTSIYNSAAVGSGSGAGNQVLDLAGESTLVVIDGAALLEAHDDPGVYLAARGEGDAWRGCGVFVSLDGGSNYTRVASVTGASTMGTITAALPVGPYELWDYANTLEVTLDTGALESRTQSAVAGGANAAWVGHPERGWELVLFADATLTGVDGQGRSVYDVSTFLRGRQGTEWAIGGSVAGDYFILASTCSRLTLESSQIGVPRIYKAVTFGSYVETGPTQNFTPQGVALEPYAPTLPEGQRDGSDNLDIYAVRRTRLTGEWNDSDFVPLNEESEAYEIDILAGGSPDTVVRTLSGSSWPITYTAAQQTTDFGSPQGSVRMLIYQLSATVGRGYPLEATL